MPPSLTFDESFGCVVTYTPAKCEVNYETNELTLSEIFDSAVDAGTILKFVIDKAVNPIGSQEAGPWSARTERIFDGAYYTVNAGYSPTSFFALSGWIRSSISYTDTLTFSEGSFAFSFLTEHDIPDNGLLEIELPVEMVFSEGAVEVQQIRHEKPSALVFDGLSSSTVVFKVPNGLKSSTTAVEITLE